MCGHVGLAVQERDLQEPAYLGLREVYGERAETDKARWHGERDHSVCYKGLSRRRDAGEDMRTSLRLPSTGRRVRDECTISRSLGCGFCSKAQEGLCAERSFVFACCESYA